MYEKASARWAGWSGWAGEEDEDEASTDLIYASHTFHIIRKVKNVKYRISNTETGLIQLVLQTAVQLLKTDPKTSPTAPHDQTESPPPPNQVHPPKETNSFGPSFPQKKFINKKNTRPAHHQKFSTPTIQNLNAALSHQPPQIQSTLIKLFFCISLSELRTPNRSSTQKPP